MKTNSTFSFIRMLFLTFVTATFTLNSVGQTTYSVTVANFSFSPKQVTITAGDKVVWKNNGGNHNVNGNQSVFPANPASFGNNLGSGWTYEFVFNTAGTYDYQCDPHAGFGMVGKVIVNPKTTTDVKILSDKSTDIIRLYPNPASQNIELMIPPKYAAISSIKIYSVAGTLIEQKNFPGNAESLQYNISQLKNGMYFMKINAGNNTDVLRFLKQ
jgi:plastocyanin